MQNRVEQFTATRPIEGELVEAATCKQTFCQWLLEDAWAWAHRSVPSAPSLPLVTPSDGSVAGLTAFLTQIAIPANLAASLQIDAASLGAANVEELRASDWAALATWSSLLPLQQRRILAQVLRSLIIS